MWLKIFIILIAILLINTSNAMAQSLNDRLQKFPAWESKPTVAIAQGDLIYPDWMEGTWQVSSTLVDLVAPLAPEIITPGFEGNRKYLQQPVNFLVRFTPQSPLFKTFPFSILPKGKQPIVSDRAFNGTQIAKAYLGENSKILVKVDPQNPNRQLTRLSKQRQLISTVTARRSEINAPNQFVATEITNQVFRGAPQIYLNEVESTTAYSLDAPGQITADQVTAIYLSPQDPNYFTAAGRPVALYRYQLIMERKS